MEQKLGQEKTFNIIKNILKHKAEFKQREYKKVQAEFGEDILSNFYLSDYFDFSTLGEAHFDETNLRGGIPYSNAIFKKLIKMPKYPINLPILHVNKEKLIHGVYMIGKDSNNRYVLFCYKIVLDRCDNYKSNKFSIKLDFCPQGKKWMELLRLDSMSPTHYNYIINEKVIDDLSQIEAVPTPHLHVNSHLCQLVSRVCPGYTSAYSVEKYLNKDVGFDKLKSAVDFMSSFANLHLPISEKVKNDYRFNFKNYLFDYEKIKYKNVEYLFEINNFMPENNNCEVEK